MGLLKVSCAQGLPSPHPVSCVLLKLCAELQEGLVPPNRPVCSAGLAHLSRPHCPVLPLLPELPFELSWFLLLGFFPGYG